MENKIPTRRSTWSSWSAYLIVAFVAAVLLALTGCGGKPTHTLDQCQIREIFTQCVAAGGRPSECQEAAVQQSLKRIALVKPECQW